MFLTAGLSSAALAFVVALPLARSSAYPAADAIEWAAPPAPPLGFQLASASTEPLVRELPMPTPMQAQAAIEWEALIAPMGIYAEPQAMVATRIPDPIWDDEAEATAPATKMAALSPMAPAASSSAVKSDEPVHVASLPPAQAPRKKVSIMDEIDAYLWDVYQRAPVKKDSSGDFTWKDQAAAKRMGVSLTAYVIGGMDPDFREQLYHAGKAMDQAGLHWSMLSAFRDNYRQQIASGFKASACNSQHGGTCATGGYGHGRAIDITTAEGKDEGAVYHWIDAHGAKFGLRRPMPGADPAHIVPQGDWHKTALALRRTRVKDGDIAVAAAEVTTPERPMRTRVARVSHHRSHHRS